jgi:hypothetical protein
MKYCPHRRGTRRPIEAIRIEIVRAIMGAFSSGLLREAYATAVPRRVVFVLEADDT